VNEIGEGNVIRPDDGPLDEEPLRDDEVAANREWLELRLGAIGALVVEDREAS